MMDRETAARILDTKTSREAILEAARADASRDRMGIVDQACEMGAAALRQADGLAVMLGLMIRTFSEGYRTDAQRIALEAAKECLREYDLQNLFGERI